MSRRPRLLDLFCGAGGASAGYARAGFDVVGVDINPMPQYPFEFHQADAVELLRRIADSTADWWHLGEHGTFDAIHASPPCQDDSLATLSQRRAGRKYPRLIGPVRELLQAQPLPWVIENVPGAPLRPDYRLCGCIFGLGRRDLGLQLRRERWFETSWHARDLLQPHHHWGHSLSIAGHGTPSWVRQKTGHIGVAIWREVMGIDWMRREELTEAIPPAYTEHVGTRLLEQVLQREAA